MKRELNLYLDEFRPKPQPWSITWLIGALLFTAVVITLHAAYLLWQNSNTRALLAQEEQIRQELQTTLSQLKKLVPNDAAIERFETERKQLRDRIDARQRYLAALAEQRQTTTRRLLPSALIAAIAAARIEPVWLNELELRCCRNNAQRLELNLLGTTNQDNALPDYLNALAQQPLLQGLSFPIFAVWPEAPEKAPQHLTFLLSTAKEDPRLQQAQATHHGSTR